MKNRTFCVVILACALLMQSSCANRAQTRQVDDVNVDLLIKNVTTIDAVNGVGLNKTVAVRGESISYVGPSKKLLATTTIDGTGKYLIPGLWDAHVHLSFEPDISKDAMFNLLLANGITSVRDTGGQLEKVMAWKASSQTSLAPDVYIAGPLIDGKPGVYLGKARGFPKIGIEVDTAENVVETVDMLAAAGVDLLKAYEMLSPPAYAALLERAEHHGLPVTGHVPLSMSAAEVSEKGLRSMEHLRNLEMDCSSNDEALLAQRKKLLDNKEQKLGSALRTEIHNAQHYSAAASYDEKRCKRLLATLAKNDTWQIPTLTLMMASKTKYYAQDDWRKTFEHLPEPLKSKWLTATATFQKRLEASLLAPSQGSKERVFVADWKMRMVKEFAEANIPIMAGTDMPIFFLTPGYSLHKELETLVSAGLTPMQVLETATLNPAKYFKKHSYQGSIEAGKMADMVLLTADPLMDIRNTQAIDTVIRRGLALDRARLDQMLKEASK